jgi:hypothetical protein
MIVTEKNCGKGRKKNFEGMGSGGVTKITFGKSGCDQLTKNTGQA